MEPLDARTSLISEALATARAAEALGLLRPADWPELAIALIVHGADDVEFGELGGLGPSVNGWDTDPIVQRLGERYGVEVPSHSDTVRTMAGVAAEDLRQRPAAVSVPMIRLLADLATPAARADLADRAFNAVDYVDCGCGGRGDLAWGAELERLPGPDLPDDLIELFMRRWREVLPAEQPGSDHGPHESPTKEHR